MNPETFLDRYTEAFDAFDPAAIAEHYHYPSILGSVDGTHAFLDRADAEARFKRVCDHHRRIGYDHAEYDDPRVDELAENLWRITVHWRFLSSGGQELAAFDCSYELGDFGGGPRITAAIVHA